MKYCEYDSFLAAVFLCLAFFTGTNYAFCWWISAQGLNASNTVYNGDYYINKNVGCGTGYWQIWNLQYNKYVMSMSYSFVNNSILNPPFKTRWAIGSIPCFGSAIAYADDDSYILPYDVPKGKWLEYNADKKVFVNNPEIEVICTGLSGWAITGIVLGSTVLLILIVLAVVFLYRFLKKPARSSRNAAVEPTANQVAAIYEDPSMTYNYIPPLYDPYQSTLPNPPSYSELPPQNAPRY